MERELWSEVRRAARAAASGSDSRGRPHPNASILEVHLWAAANNKPAAWACRPGSWPVWERRRRLPSPSTLSRRLRTPELAACLARALGLLRVPAPAGAALVIDAKPLPVGEYTKDAGARNGRALRGFARGYKLFAVIDESHNVLAFRVGPMSMAEQAAARETIPEAAASAGPGATLLGDRAYDSNALYELAHACGLRLLAPRIHAGRRGVSAWGQSPRRLEAVALLEGPGSGPLAREAASRRDTVERFFGHLSSFWGGLSPLPAWARTLPRVTRWVAAKLVVNAARIRVKWLARRAKMQ